MRTIEDMIQQEVLLNVSGLVDTLVKGVGTVDRGELETLTEEALELACPVADYEEAAREAGWVPSIYGDPDAYWQKMDDEDGRQVAVAIADTVEEACEQDGIEPHEREVFEFWVVTRWFADKLEDHGEKVARDFAGHDVWARTTTGQAISMDAVIQDIYNATHN